MHTSHVWYRFRFPFTPPTRPSNNTTIKLSNLSNIYRLVVLWIQYSDSIFEQKSIPFYSSFFTFPGTYDHDNAFNGRAFFIWHPYPFLNDEEHHQIDKKRSQGNIIVLLLATHPWQVVLPFTLDIWVGSWYEEISSISYATPHYHQQLNQEFINMVVNWGRKRLRSSGDYLLW